jgi:hypothetical protein
VATEKQTDDLIEESWRLLRELVTTGKCTLSSGVELAPKPHLLIRTIQDVAKLKPPKSRRMAQVDDFRLTKTTKEGE